MPVALTAAESKIVNAAMKRADALLKRTDKDKNGTLDEAELKGLMAKVEKMTNKLSDAEGSDPKEMLKSKMTDANRTLMATMQGISAFAEAHGDLDTIAVKDASAAVRAGYANLFDIVHSNKGGLEGALGMMMAAMCLPKAAAPIIAQALAAQDP